MPSARRARGEVPSGFLLTLKSSSASALMPSVASSAKSGPPCSTRGTTEPRGSGRRRDQLAAHVADDTSSAAGRLLPAGRPGRRSNSVLSAATTTTSRA